MALVDAICLLYFFGDNLCTVVQIGFVAANFRSVLYTLFTGGFYRFTYISN